MRFLFIFISAFFILSSSISAQMGSLLPGPASLSPAEQAQLSQVLSNQKGASPPTTATPENLEKEKERKARLQSTSSLERFFSPTENLNLKSSSSLSSGLNDPTFKESSGKILQAVDDTSGKQFGYNAFSGASEFKSLTGFINPGPSYVLGTGDILDVKIWGKFQDQMILTIDESGRVFLPNNGYIYLAGYTLSQATEKIRDKVSTLYTNFQLDVSLSRLRTIKIFVLGEVFSPGSYEVTSLSTLLSGLYMAGGPKKVGSLRNIKLIRNNRVIKVIDLYDYLLRGDNRQDPQLQTLDTIFVPVIGDVIQLTGVVKRPGIFEISGRVNAHDAIFEYAGGPSLGYYGKRIQIERIVEGEKKVIADLKFDNAQDMEKRLKRHELISGDILRVLPILSTLHHVVAIKGNVHRPGDFEYVSGMTLQDLFNQAGGLLEDTYQERVYVYKRDTESQRSIIQYNLRETPASQIKLSEFDIVEVFSLLDVNGGQSVQISGSVEHQGVYRLFNQMTMSDLVFLAKPTEHAHLGELELVRQDVSGNRIREVHPHDQFKTVFLKPNDQIFVREATNKFQATKVTLSGQVKFPGSYVILDGDTLGTIIERAGGLTEKSFPKGMVFVRQSQHTDQEGYQKVIYEERKRLLYEKSQVADEGKAEQQRQSHEAALNFLTQEISKGVNRVVLNGDDITLHNGDSIFVPEIPRVIQVYGGVKQPTSFVFEEGKTVSYYISKAGGYSQYAVPKRMMVIRANGAISEHSKEIQRGDSIYIPEDITIRYDFITVLLDVTKILANVATTLLLIRSI